MIKFLFFKKIAQQNFFQYKIYYELYGSIAQFLFKYPKRVSNIHLLFDNYKWHVASTSTLSVEIFHWMKLFSLRNNIIFLIC